MGNLLICGSRNFDNYEIVSETIKNLDIGFDLIISGGAKGADTLAKKYCVDNNINIKEYLPEWDRYGRGAGIQRNKEMLKVSDFVLIFWDGKSKGTKFNVEYCQKNNKEHKIILI
jgi:hypothetical protein